MLFLLIINEKFTISNKKQTTKRPCTISAGSIHFPAIPFFRKSIIFQKKWKISQNIELIPLIPRNAFSLNTENVH